MRKFLSVMLSLILLLTMVTPVFADGIIGATETEGMNTTLMFSYSELMEFPLRQQEYRHLIGFRIPVIYMAVMNRMVMYHD